MKTKTILVEEYRYTVQGEFAYSEQWVVNTGIDDPFDLETVLKPETKLVAKKDKT